MQYRSDAPLIVQADRSILLDTHAPSAVDARYALIPFAELEKSPEHLHTYRLTPLSLWSARSAGMTTNNIIAALERYARFPVAQGLITWIQATMDRYGKIELLPSENPDFLLLTAHSMAVFAELKSLRKLSAYLLPADIPNSFLMPVLHRGTVKQVLLKQGWPVQDSVPLRDGDAFTLSLKKISGKQVFTIRDYQQEAADSFVGNKGAGTGFGTIVLPCGSGKTIVGMLIMNRLQTNTLILTTNISAVHQWKRELLEKTDIHEEDIGLYTGESKNIKAVTIATYQVLTWRQDVNSDFPHFKIFSERRWGLIIYDEVHLLPAPVFRITAELQIIRRLGLTATLVREDGREGDVFSLVGPKRYDVPWKDLEQRGWIARAFCTEVRIDIPRSKEIAYAVAPTREKYRIASENSEKTGIVEKILALHPDEPILVIGQYISQLETIAKKLHAPLIMGKTPSSQRELLYAAFRDGSVRVLVVSKVANFAIDLPDAAVAVQISGSFGSRQEEAQRLGRILRPKERDSHFYTIVTRHTVEETFAEKRQKFLAEQGYEYSILTAEDIDTALCCNNKKG